MVFGRIWIADAENLKYVDLCHIIIAHAHVGTGHLGASLLKCWLIAARRPDSCRDRQRHRESTVADICGRKGKSKKLCWSAHFELYCERDCRYLTLCASKFLLT